MITEFKKYKSTLKEPDGAFQTPGLFVSNNWRLMCKMSATCYETKKNIYIFTINKETQLAGYDFQSAFVI